MPFKLDPEIEAILAPIIKAKGNIPAPAIGDIDARRVTFYNMLGAFNSGHPVPEDVVMQDYYAQTADNHPLLLRWYTKKSANPSTSNSPAVVYIHGGGMILGSVSHWEHIVARYVSASGVPFLSVEYRYAPDYLHPTPLEDAFCGLTWLRDHASELNVDPASIAIMGDSAGGGIAAGVALLSRDRHFNPPIAKQILIYPMLDDRTIIPDPNIVPFATWTYEDNKTGWGALFGSGSVLVSPYAAPARMVDLAGLPPTYIEVGQLDIFLNEDIEYARRLSEVGIATELHVHPGCPHAFEVMPTDTDVAKRSFADRIRVLQSF